MEEAGVGVVRKGIEVVEVRVLRGERDRLRMRVSAPVAVLIDADRERSVDAAAVRRIGDRVADGYRVRRLAEREGDVLPGQQLDGLPP
jgi:hypothetical protein